MIIVFSSSSLKIPNKVFSVQTFFYLFEAFLEEMNSQWDCIVSKNACFQQIFMVAEKKTKEIFSTVKEYRRHEVSSIQVLLFFSVCAVAFSY